MEAKYKGIDVSKWQGDINWEKVRASGVEFAMLRAGFGRCQGQNDTSFERNYREAKKNGILVGAYQLRKNRLGRRKGGGVFSLAYIRKKL